MADDIARTSPLHRSVKDLVESRRIKPHRNATWFDQMRRRRGGQAQRAAKSNPYRVKLTAKEVKRYNKKK